MVSAKQQTTREEVRGAVCVFGYHASAVAAMTRHCEFRACPLSTSHLLIQPVGVLTHNEAQVVVCDGPGIVSRSMQVRVVCFFPGVESCFAAMFIFGSCQGTFSCIYIASV
jgi:hypothetical protein